MTDAVERSTTSPDPMPIAIVGIGCRFPGGIVDAESFWRVLAEGVDAITEIPASRFDIARLYDARPATPGRIMTRLGGYLDRLEEFDAAFFGISPVQAERMDPQQRLLLETAWEALEDAGADIGALAGTPTGVFVGQWVSDFENRLFADPSGIDFPMTLGSGRYAASGRLSYAFGFRGPSLTLDAACSSSLAAVHLAVRSLRAGDGDVALAGGVNIILQPHIHLAYSQSRMMAPDGRCKFGDVSGDGYVRAEGAAMVVLKPLAKALADGDRVYAVVRGSAVNNDGDSSGSMGRPSRVGQEELVRAALADAHLAPSRIGYVEAHGTGTRAGDPVELDALTAVLGQRARADRAWVGSVKTNFGHTEAAAGVAGLIKATLALHHGMVPPSLHFRDPNPAIAWDTVPLAIPTQLTEWPRGVEPRVAGVSSYGIGGTNAHVLLEEAPTAEAEAPLATAETDAGPALLPISARSVAATRALAARYADLLERHPEVAVGDVCWSAATRRTVLTDRAAFAAGDRASLVDALRAYAAGGPATAEGTSHTRGRPKVAFVVPGQGAQWAGMAREMAAQEPAFRIALEECDAAARPYASWSILEQLALDPGAPGYLGDRIDVIQPVLVAIAIAYARWLRSIGVAPDAVVGHSMGEVGAAAIAGILDTAQAMRIICRRSALMLRTSGQGAMAVVELTMEEAESRVAAHAGRLSVAVSNAPRSTVISGDPAAVQQVVAELERDGIFARLVKVDVASHSPQMDPLAAELRSELADLAPAGGAMPMYSTVAGAMVPGADFDAGYWARNLRQPVRFADAVNRLLDDGVSVFVELGPHPVLTQAVQQNAAATERPATAIVCGRRNESDRLGAYAAVAGLWVAGAGPTWSLLMPAGRLVPLPLYAWQRETYWVDAAQPARADGAPRARPALSDGQRGWLYVPRWTPAPMEPGTARRTVLVGAPAELRLPGAEPVATVADAARLVAGSPADGREIDVVLVVDPGAAAPAWDAVDAIRTLQAAWPTGRPAPRLHWVTTGAQRVADETPSPHAAEQGAVWGAARVIATEHPDWWGGLVDLDPSLPLAAQSETLARHLAARRTEDQVALRGGARFALRLTRASTLGAAASYQWRTDGAYLVTGGFGGIAQRVATEMVRQGARRLVLLGRSALPPRASWGSLAADSPAGQRVAFVRALELAGASVHVLHADVTDGAQLRSALDGYRAEGWPPIVGVLHTAGVLDTRLTRDMDADAFARVLAPKLAGAVALDRLLPELDLFVAFSSMMAFWAPPGEANYSAANAGLDALVQARRARGQHALAIEWGPWTDVGMWQGSTGDRSMQALAREGVRSFSAAEGVAFLGPLLSAREPVVAVMPVDWTAFAAARRGRPSPLFQGLVDGAAPAEQVAAGSSLPGQLREASPLARRALVDTLVRATLGTVLRRSAEGIDATRPFGTMGLDSLMALDLRNRLETALERPLPATLAWNYPTVAGLAAHLETLFADATTATAPEPTPEPAAASAESGFNLDSLFDDLTLLSDEDAARALRGGR